MNTLLESFADHRKAAVAVGAVGLLATFLTLSVLRTGSQASQSPPLQKNYNAKVKRVLSGHSVKLKSGDRLNYAGIRSPFPSERLHDEARRRNAELVEGRRVRLRFDQEPRDKKDRIRAYVFTSKGFVNELLVKEGLAYVRLKATEQRFAKQLLAAQADAQRHRRGLWKGGVKSSASGYAANTKHGNFHRTNCEEAAATKPQHRQTFRTKRKALAAGFAPCVKCQP